MDRGMIYPGQVPLETDLLFAQRASMVGLSKLAAAILGTGTVVNGLAVTQTGVASMSVQVAAGEIYQIASLDATAYSSLAADTTHQVVKQGVNLDTTLLALTAPGTGGFSVNFLIQATLTEADNTPVVLPYYNSSNPATAYSGPAGAGTAQSTRRTAVVTLSAKAGTAAATGSQTTPAPDAGNVGIAVVTVANGAATVVNANISAYAGAPIMAPGNSGRLLNVQRFSASGTYTPTLGMNSVVVEVQGGGGAGGGTPVTGAGQSALAAGGSSGAYGKGRFTAAQVGTSQTVTVGPGGSGAVGAAGGNGSTSSLGALLSAPGGVGGSIGSVITANSTSLVPGTNPGSVATGGTIVNATGLPGQMGLSQNSGGFFSGGGGGSPIAGGGGGGNLTGTTTSGDAGKAPGAGGSASCGGVSDVARAGGNGAAGLVVVYEYA